MHTRVFSYPARQVVHKRIVRQNSAMHMNATSKIIRGRMQRYGTSLVARMRDRERIATHPTIGGLR